MALTAVTKGKKALFLPTRQGYYFSYARINVARLSEHPAVLGPLIILCSERNVKRTCIKSKWSSHSYFRIRPVYYSILVQLKKI